MFSRTSKIKCDVAETLCGGAHRSVREISALTATPEHSVRKALSELSTVGCVRRDHGSDGVVKGGRTPTAYSLEPDIISAVADLSVSPAVLHICRLYTGKCTDIIAPVPDRCDADSFISTIAKGIASYIEKNMPDGKLRALTFLFDSSSTLPKIFPPHESGEKTEITKSGVKLIFWSRDELAARLAAKAIKSEVTLYVEITGENSGKTAAENMKAFIFRPARRYEIPIGHETETAGEHDPEEVIIRKIKALCRAFSPDAVYISAPYGGARLERGITEALGGDLSNHGAFCSKLFSHNFEKEMINEAARIAIGLI